MKKTGPIGHPYYACGACRRAYPDEAPAHECPDRERAIRIVSTTLAGPGSHETIGRALRSIAPHVDECIVLVTVDGPEGDLIAEAAWGPTVTRRRWLWQDDFGAARNAALAFAEEAGATWCVWLDSDEWISGGEEIRPFLSDITAHPLHVIRDGEAPKALPDRAVMMAHEGGDYWQPRAIRLPCAARWDGRVHEAIPLTGPRFSRAVFCDEPKTPEQMAAKRARDLEALWKMTRERPNDPRWWYYLADAEAAVGEVATAVVDFDRCARLPGWDEQAAWAAYRAADLLTNVLGRHEEAVQTAAHGLARHAGIGELAWIAGLASLRLGRHEQAIAWARLAEVNGKGSPAEVARVLFRVEKGLTWGPADVASYACEALGRHGEAFVWRARAHEKGQM